MSLICASNVWNSSLVTSGDWESAGGTKPAGTAFSCAGVPPRLHSRMAAPPTAAMASQPQAGMPIIFCRKPPPPVCGGDSIVGCVTGGDLSWEATAVQPAVAEPDADRQDAACTRQRCTACDPVVQVPAFDCPSRVLRGTFPCPVDD